MPRVDPLMQETVSVVHSAAIPQVELLIIDHSLRHWRVYHENYTFAAARMPSAAAEWWYRGKVYTADPDVAAMIEPGEMHVTRRLLAPSCVTVVEASPAFVSEAAREFDMGSVPHFPSAQPARPGLNQALLAFGSAVQRNASPLEQQTLLYDCFAFMFRHCAERKVRDSREDARGARVARDYLHARAAERVTLDDLARISGLSRYHLVRSFRRHYGVPPHAYQTAIRIAAVRHAIRAGVPLSELDVGFADQSHLSRFFKRTFSVTPGRYASAFVRPIAG